MTKFGNDYYYVSCFPLKATKDYGLMLNFDHSNFILFSKDIVIYSILLILLALMITGGILRKIVYKKLLLPLNELRGEIMLQLSNPNSAPIDTLDYENKCEEINTIQESFYKLLGHLRVEYTKNTDLQSKAALAHLARRLAHDIRSPLVALNIVLKQLPNLPEKQRILMLNSSKRINDIANNLLQYHKSNENLVVTKSENNNVWLIAPIIEGMVSEKRLQYNDKAITIESEISESGFASFANIDLIEVKRLLSNLINNSAESFHNNQGKINISLDADENKIYLKIIDDGSGIPEDKLTKVTTGISYKPQGSGLGLSHAKDFTESIGGIFQITSQVNHGTTVSIIFPRSKAPNWFVSEIVLLNNYAIAILDDDQSVHDAWDQRLNLISENLNINHFISSEELKNWYQNQIRPIQLFSDFELLGEIKTGLDILEEIGAGKNSILVTSHYENPNIISRCETQKIGLLPKNLLAHIQIRLE